VDAGEEFFDGSAPAVGDAAQERGEAGAGHPGGGMLGRVAAQERDRHVAIQPGEQADRAGGDSFQQRPQLVG
jgi:hypothetical protein